MAYLLLLLESLPAVQEGERCGLEKYADSLASALKTALRDALGDVRSLGRTSFWAFARHFPTRTNRILQALDHSTAKLVQVPPPSSAGLTAVGVPLVTALTMSLSGGGTALLRRGTVEYSSATGATRAAVARVPPPGLDERWIGAAQN